MEVGGYIGYMAEDGEEVVVDGAGDPAVHGDVEGVSGELEGHDLALEEPDVAIGVEDASLKRSRKTVCHVGPLGQLSNLILRMCSKL